MRDVDSVYQFLLENSFSIVVVVVIKFSLVWHKLIIIVASYSTQPKEDRTLLSIVMVNQPNLLLTETPFVRYSASGILYQDYFLLKQLFVLSLAVFIYLYRTKGQIESKSMACGWKKKRMKKKEEGKGREGSKADKKDELYSFALYLLLVKLFKYLQIQRTKNFI